MWHPANRVETPAAGLLLPCGKSNNSKQLLLLVSLIFRRALRLHSIMTNKAPGYLEKMINAKKGHCHHWMKGLCLISSDHPVPVVLCQHIPAFLCLGVLLQLLSPINLSGRCTSMYTQRQESERQIIVLVGHLDIYLPKGSVSLLGGAASMKAVGLRFLICSGCYNVSLRRSGAV